MAKRSAQRFAIVAIVYLCVSPHWRVSTQSLPAGAYVIADLGTLGGAESQAYAINGDAQVVGAAQRADGTTHAFLYSGKMARDLGTIGGATSVATGINRAGQVVGRSLSSIGNTKAVLWSNGTIRSLGTLGGANSAAYAINNAGEIVGSASTTGNTAIRAFLYRNGTMTRIGTTFGGTNSVATAINQFGAIAGYASTAGNASTRAFVYQGGVTTPIPSLGGASEATAINDIEQVVGRSAIASGAWHAFFYDGSTVADLGTLGGTNSTALGVNVLSQVVGFSDVPAGGTHAFLYQNGTMRDLNEVLPAGSGWVLEAATAIDDAGEVVGYGRHNGVRHAFRLLPPATVFLFSGGALSQVDSNIPRGGVQAGRNLTFVTSLDSQTGEARNIVLTATLSGPVEIVGTRTYQGLASCSVSGLTVTCTIGGLGPLFVFDEEVHVITRVTGAGPISYHAHFTADNVAPDAAHDALQEENAGVALSAFTLSTSTTAGGKPVSARVDLTPVTPPGGAVVRITTSDPTIAPVPATVVVQLPTTFRKFNIVPAVVSRPTPVTLTATYGLVTLTRTLIVVPPELSSLSLTRSTIIGACQTASGKITLTGTAPSGGALIPLATTTAGAHVPSAVTVPGGATSVNFTVTTTAVNAFGSGTLTASYGGVSKTLNLAVRPIYVSSVALTPSTVTGGSAVSGLVTTECAAPSGGIPVALSSSNTAVAAPTVASITVPAGGTTAQFPVRTSRVPATTTAAIKAAAHGVARNATLTVHP